MLKGVEETAKQTLHLIDGIKELMQHYKQKIRTELPKIYSQDLLNNLFKHPYTKIEFVEKELYIEKKEKRENVTKRRIYKKNKKRKQLKRKKILFFSVQ